MAFSLFGLELRWKQRPVIGEEPLTSHNAANAQTLNFVTHDNEVKPAYTSESLVNARCRYYARESAYLKSFLPLKLAVFNYGFKLVPAEKKDQEKLDKWLAEDSPPPVDEFEDSRTQEKVGVESNTTNGERVVKFVEDAWNNRFIFNSLIAMWRDETQYALILQPERVSYTDVRGVEIVRYTHGMSQADVQRYLPKEAQERFSKPEIILNPNENEHFKVLKPGAVGEGLGTPSLFAIFDELDEEESLTVGMKTMAFGLRTVKRCHVSGHPIEGGIHAGKPMHFLKKERATATLAVWRDRVGFDDYAHNFDQEVKYPWPDVKLFDPKYFDALLMRLNAWAGPLAQMYFVKGVNPALAMLLKAEARAEREKMGEFLGSVINKAFGIGAPIKVQWSNTIFNEARLQMEMLKFAVQNGLVSNQTAQEEYGLNPAQEDERKLAEADDPDAGKKHKPLWDQAHGVAPALGESSQKAADGGAGKGQKPGTQNGKPPGTKDAS